MAEAETASDSTFLEYSGPTPGVKYPLNVIYCPPDSKCGHTHSFVGVVNNVVSVFGVTFFFL